MNKKYFLYVAALLMAVIGLLRGFGGIALFLKGNKLDTQVPIIASTHQIMFVSIGLLVVSILLIVAALYLLIKKTKKSWYFSWIVLIIFLIGGIFNGFVLFGQPLDQGQKINIAAFFLAGIFLISGKPALKN